MSHLEKSTQLDGVQHAAGKLAQEGDWYPYPFSRHKLSPETCLLLCATDCPQLSHLRVTERQQAQALQQGLALCNRMAEASCFL